MRDFLAIFFALLWQHASAGDNVGLNLPCNKDMDGLLAADPDGNPNAFLSCQGVGVGTIGFWERKVCPSSMVFDFINQQCKYASTSGKKSRKPMLKIAILNNSCARGETCIGGTVCDLDKLKCLCPYGTLPQLDTLSCVKTESMMTQETPAFNFNSFAGQQQSGIGFLPNPTTSSAIPNFLQPKPFGQQYGNGNNFKSNNNNNQMPVWNGNSFGNFQPNNQFGVMPQQQKQIPLLARPGQSCKQNEICVGGSICTLPIGLCLCPGELEESDGECVLPPSASISISKVGIGAICSDLAECDHGSTCVMGRCACVAPLIQREGKCVLRQDRKEVGPGELCDNGEVCIGGSVCDSVIPVCVCPPETDLNDGRCVIVESITRNNNLRPITQRPPITLPPPTLATNPTHVFPPTYTPPPSNVNNGPQNGYGQQAVIKPQPPVVPVMPPVSNIAVPIHNYQTIPTTLRPTVKPNQMKINLGGSKQAGVGVRCSLNTDCMIGAYCNGNTNPPSCQCLSTHVNIDGRCEKVVYPGQIGCQNDLQCSTAYTGTSCIDRICVCPEGSKAVDQTCVPDNEPITSPPGGACSDARQCTGGSVCREGWCICPDPTMIVQKGICIQSGIRPTLPPKPTAATPPPIAALYTATRPPQPTYQPTAPPATRAPPPPPVVRPVQYNAIPSAQGKKAIPGTYCGPFDTCVGGSNCVDGVCLCPVGLSPSQNGRCERPSQPKPTPQLSVHRPPVQPATPATAPPTLRPVPVVTAPPTVATQPPPQVTTIYAKPGDDCSTGQLCTGGSACATNGLCACPSERPEIRGGHCMAEEKPVQKHAGPGESCDENTICTRESTCNGGLCRCGTGYVAVSGYCVSLPMPTTPVMKTIVFAKPLENCENGETCEGGSSCDDDTGVCMCPRGQIAFNAVCQDPPTRPPVVATTTQKTTQRPTRPTETTVVIPYRPQSECADDTNCAENKICVVGRCKCRPGFVDNAGFCEPLEELEIGERPVPISYAKHQVETFSSERHRSADEEVTTSEEEATTRAPMRQLATKGPRIVGPPIRRPKPKKPKGSSGGGSSGGGGGSGSYKTGSGNGNCPPGNEATRDGSGSIILCNGLEPNCPPRSYCYITSGGFATEEYNCCKSW